MLHECCLKMGIKHIRQIVQFRIPTIQSKSVNHHLRYFDEKRAKQRLGPFHGNNSLEILIVLCDFIAKIFFLLKIPNIPTLYYRGKDCTKHIVGLAAVSCSNSCVFDNILLVLFYFFLIFWFFCMVKFLCSLFKTFLSFEVVVDITWVSTAKVLISI